MRPGPPRATLRLWLGCVCLALVQAGKGARAGARGARRGAGGRDSSGPFLLPAPQPGPGLFPTS